MNSNAKFKKNMTRIICLVLAGVMLLGSFAYFTMDEAALYSYSDGLTKEGFFEGVTALDNVILPDYKAYTMPEEHTVATEAEIEDYIAKEIMADFTTTEKDTDADRVAANGDYINIDFDGKIDGVAFEGGSTQGQGTDITLGSKTFIDGFEDQIVGHKAGETFDITVTFPEDYGNEDLNGKEAVFTIALNHIYKTVTPELNDAFIAENLADQYTDLADLKEKVAVKIVDTDTKNYVWTKLMEETVITNYPDEVYNYEVGARKANLEAAAAQYGFAAEDLVAMNGYETIDDYIIDSEDDILYYCNVYLTVQAICEKEGFTVTDEDMAHYFETIFNTTDYSDYVKAYGEPYLKSVVIRDVMLTKLMADMEVVPTTAE